MRQHDLDEELVAWDSWRATHGGDFAMFVQERGLDKRASEELREILALGNDLWRVADDKLKKQHSFTKELLTRELGNRFDFLSELGAGGMGTVWLAEQTEPIQRKVAVKLIRNDLVSDSMRKRFAFEQQALASLSHPNIATVYEAGETESGRPYFVMEYIPGEKITDYCNRQKLNLASRLGLFLQVCDGIQHAHRKGLVHRDLKPGNLIVMEENGVPVAKVIDFGLAKGTAKILAQDSLTRTNAVIGSPVWMSPEQARVYGNGDVIQVGNRTDVYSLGAILYQLLTNSTPIPTEFFRDAPPVKVFEAIRNQIPDYPSRRLHERQFDSKSWIESSSDSSFAAWVGSLKDELDWVVMKAIEKDAARRYGTIGEFVSDIDRFIRGDSVSARPPSKFYQFRKMVGRNRILAASIAAVTLTLIVATCISTLYAINTNKAQKLAEQRLESSQKLINAIASSFEVFNFGDGSVKNNKLKSRLLTEFGNRIEAELATLPKDLPPDELAGREFFWRQTYLSALVSAGLERESTIQLKKIISYLTPLVDHHDARLVESRAALAELLTSSNKVQKAKLVAEDNFSIVKKYYPTDHYLYLLSEKAWLDATQDSRSYEDNLTGLEKVIDKAQTLESEVGDQLRIATMQLAADCCGKAKEHRLAIQWLDQARKLSNEMRPDDLRTMKLEFKYWQEVSIYQDGQETHAERLRERLEAVKEKLGPSHPMTLEYQSLYSFFLSMRGIGPAEENISLIRETLATSEKELGPEHRITCESRVELLQCLFRATEYEQVIEAFESLSEAIEKYSGEDSYANNSAGKFYTMSLFELKRFEESIEVAKKYQLHEEMIRALVELKRYDEVAEKVESLLAGSKLSTKAEIVTAIDPVKWLAKSYFDNGEMDRAIEHLDLLDTLTSKVYPPTHVDCLLANHLLQYVYWRNGQYDRSNATGFLLLNVLHPKSSIPEYQRENYLSACLALLARCSFELGDLEDIELYWSQYQEIKFNHPRVAPVDYVFKAQLARVKLKQSQEEQAESLLLELLEELVRYENHPGGGPGDETTQLRTWAHSSLSKIYRDRGNEDKANEYKLKAKNQKQK